MYGRKGYAWGVQAGRWGPVARLSVCGGAQTTAHTAALHCTPRDGQYHTFSFSSFLL